MLIRAAIVILVILNIGTGLWWLTQPAYLAPVPTEELAGGVAALELLPIDASSAEVPAPLSGAHVSTAEGSVPTPSAEPVKPATETMPAPAPRVEPASAKVAQCASFGPYPDEAAARAALAKLGEGAQRSRVRELARPASGNYRVMLPASASREEAQAVVKRIADAGISDYFIIASGDDVNAVALGQYRNREGAERRVAQMQAAGFPAVLVPASQQASASWWLDLAVAEGVSLAQAATRAGASNRQSLDCTSLR